MAIETKKTWGKVRLAQIHAAWDDWKQRHPGIYSECYANASLDGGMWCACVRLFVRKSGSMVADSTTPIGRAYLGEDAASKTDVMDLAVKEFALKCATL